MDGIQGRQQAGAFTTRRNHSETRTWGQKTQRSLGFCRTIHIFVFVLDLHLKLHRPCWKDIYLNSVAVFFFCVSLLQGNEPSANLPRHETVTSGRTPYLCQCLFLGEFSFSLVVSVIMLKYFLQRNGGGNISSKSPTKACRWATFTEIRHCLYFVTFPTLLYIA